MKPEKGLRIISPYKLREIKPSNTFRVLPIPIDDRVSVGFPKSPFRHLIANYLQLKRTGNDDKNIHPSGCSAIVCRLDCNQPESFLVGTPTFCREAEYVTTDDCTFFVAFLWPGSGYYLFKNSTSEIVDTYLPLKELLPEFASRFTEEMECSKTFARRMAIFEQCLSNLIPDLRLIPSHHQTLLKKNIFSQSHHENDGYCQVLGERFTNRHIRRIFIKYLGVAPNIYFRIKKYQKALGLITFDPLISMTDLSVNLGYFDQSHFIKDFKRFHGMTPKEFARQHLMTMNAFG